MKIEHIAIWTEELENMKDFYSKYFNMQSSDKYYNEKKKYTSYFLSFKSGARIEIMHRPDIEKNFGRKGEMNGFAHIAISVGNKEEVDKLTELIRNNGFVIYGEPRYTGDGYYESIIKDPDGNLVEITE